MYDREVYTMCDPAELDIARQIYEDLMEEAIDEIGHIVKSFKHTQLSYSDIQTAFDCAMQREW